MHKLIFGTVALASMTFGAQQALADSITDQVETFRAERLLLDRALVRCNEIVADKFRSQLYGLNAVNGEARKPIEAAANTERNACKANWSRKASALYDKQSQEVHAYYNQRSAMLKAEKYKIDEEAVR